MATSYTKVDFSDSVKELVSSKNTDIKDRYDAKLRLRLQDNKLVVRALRENDLVATKTSSDIIHTVTLNEIKRPDLIALKFYGDARLYWIILGANGLRDRTEVLEGMKLRIPSKSAVYGVNGLLSDY